MTKHAIKNIVRKHTDRRFRIELDSNMLTIAIDGDYADDKKAESAASRVRAEIAGAVEFEDSSIDKTGRGWQVFFVSNDFAS